jgi:two-component system sensor histidine kinase AlgZ
MSKQSNPVTIDEQSVLPNLCRDKSVFFLVVVAQLFVVLLLLADTTLGVFNWQRLAIMTIHVQWVCLMSAALICWTRGMIAHRSNAQKIVIAYGICVVTGIGVSMAGQYLLYGKQIDPAVVARHTLMTMLVALLVLRYFYLQFLLVRQSKAELSSRLQALHSRIRPHFLFNSLNSVASLIPVDPQRAERAVEDLADIFRATLKQSFDLVPLSQEIALCKRYLSLESLRLGDRLHVNWHEHANLDAWQVPQLTLQPLLENAIVHGIQQRASGGDIDIQLHDSDKMLKVTVTNPLPTTHHKSTGNQMGVENIQDRLQAVYGEQAKVQGMERDGRYICVVNIPKNPS